MPSRAHFWVSVEAVSTVAHYPLLDGILHTVANVGQHEEYRREHLGQGDSAPLPAGLQLQTWQQPARRD
jgi:hypothetical protein